MSELETTSDDYRIESNGFAPTDGTQYLKLTIHDDVDNWDALAEDLEKHLPIGAVNALKRKHGDSDE